MTGSATLPAWPDVAPRCGPVTLRAFRVDDWPLGVALGADRYATDIGSLEHGADESQARAWVERQIGRHAEGRGFSFAVEIPETDVAVGSAGLWPAAMQPGRCSVGYAVDPRMRGRSLGSYALRALVGFAWTLPHVQRVEAFIEEWNIGSLRAAERAGMRYEGTLRSYMDLGGRWADQQVWGMVRGDDLPAWPS